MALQTYPMIAWLLSSDVSIQYETQRDLLDAPESTLKTLQKKIALEGWGARLLSFRDRHTRLWGNGIYSPKWTSTHYTLLELKNMGIDPAIPEYSESTEILLHTMWHHQGKVRKTRHQDMCVTAMILDIAAYAHIQCPEINEMVDYILEHQYHDGGWNCAWERGDEHSSLHTTISVLEAFRDYEKYGYSYKLPLVKKAVPKGAEFILKKHLFKAEHTGEVINPHMITLSYPCRWHYDILRAMDYFASIKFPFDLRMSEALDIIISKRSKTGHWPVQDRYSGTTHFLMERTGGDSHWNTLRVLRVLRFYKPEMYATLLK
ncbi:MAG: hypothetical protein NTV44_06695 [Firmicutes bacterium]|nr:hypothetical protein [Bacillota bacterium]